MSLAERITRDYGGNWHGHYGLIPSPGHSKKDRGLKVEDRPDAPDGLLVHSFNGADPLAFKDELRERGYLKPFEPRAGSTMRFGPGANDEVVSRKAPVAKCRRNPGVEYFEFQDADGVTVCRKVRTDRADGTKTFAWQHPDGKGGWAPGRSCGPLLYRLPELLTASNDAVVYVAEGERKADKLANWGFVATSSKDLPEDLSAFADRTVVVLPDNDDQGQKIAADLVDRLQGIAERAVILDLPGLPPKGDIIDWAAAGRSAFELAKLTEEALGEGEDELASLDLAELAKVRPQAKAFAIERLAPLAEVTLFTGAGSAGKSLLAQQLCTAAAGGIDCLRMAVQPGPAIYLSCEDDADQLHWRQAHLCDRLGLDMASLADRLHLISLRGALDNHLGDFDHTGKLSLAPAYHRLARKIRATGAKLACLDNVSHLFTGNENDRGQVTRFVNLLNRLAGETGAAIILLGHPSKPSRPGERGHSYSGSTAWLNAVRSQFTVEHDLETDVRTLTVGKANYAQKGEALRFLWQDWAFVHEDDLPADQARELTESIRAAGDNQIFLDCLAERNRRKQAVSERSCGSYAPTVFAKMPESKGIGRERLERAMDRLFRIDRIERAELWRGPDRKAVFGLRETQTGGPLSD